MSAESSGGGGLPAAANADAAPRLRRLPIVMAGLLVAVCLVMFVAIIASMWHTVREESGSIRYDFLTGEPIRVSDMTLLDTETAFLAITAQSLDEEKRVVTLRLSGHRVCDQCLPYTLQLFALDSNPQDWWGLPPSESLDLPTATTPFNTTVSLPVSGRPARYPIDGYQVRLAVALVRKTDDGGQEYMTAAGMKERQFLVAVNEEVPRFRIDQPAVIAVPEDAQARGLISALDLRFKRPLYLPLVSTLLVVLILISSALSTVLQETQEVFLGLGSIILGVWGISSIVVQTSYKGLTLVDLSLATVIMIVLLGISIRGALMLARRPGRG